MTSFEEARQILQKESTDGVCLYDHLAEVVLKVLSDKLLDGSESFEHLSAAVKEARATPQKPVAGVSEAAARAAQINWATSAQSLFAVPDEPPEGGPRVPDLLDEANMWAAAGISFGASETYRIFLAVKRLAETLPGDHETLRFWGQVKGRSADYLVVEGRALEEQLGDTEEAGIEGTVGANRYTYWVSTGAGAPWTQLPPVTPAQIVAARKIRRYLTGDLDAAVPGYPPFPGTERNFLRAQIARITAGTAVSPSGFFEADADADPGEIKAAEEEAINEAFPKPASDLASADAWVHHELELNKLGRNRPLPEPEEGAEPPSGPEEDPPEEVPPLRSLAEDEEGAWGFRTSPAGAGATANSAAVAKSLLWPGAYAIAAGRRATCVYVGHAVKHAAAPYEPPAAPPLRPEWAPEGYAEALAEATAAAAARAEARAEAAAAAAAEAEENGEPAAAPEPEEEGASLFELGRWMLLELGVEVGVRKWVECEMLQRLCLKI
ncbi:putative flagellar radial spoke protein 4 [Tribonema minus]|uniref:Putative flagellar radial spoke protein 4 n=1 Tax=Tribonema minus TaxID=303371 RepID=A0A835YNL7_9STRA|nr:putative flagellar radial spoke protein 4 [Tribonema minus]